MVLIFLSHQSYTCIISHQSSLFICLRIIGKHDKNVSISIFRCMLDVRQWIDSIYGVCFMCREEQLECLGVRFWHSTSFNRLYRKLIIIYNYTSLFDWDVTKHHIFSIGHHSESCCFNRHVMVRWKERSTLHLNF